MTAYDGFGNTPWGGNIVNGVTPSDGYGPMGWSNEGDTSNTAFNHFKRDDDLRLGRVVRAEDGRMTG